MRRLGQRLLGRANGAAMAICVALLGGAPVAGAEEQPSIVKAYGMDWIQHVRDDAWPDPKERRPVICLLDTGVAVTPDTPADDPAGPIVARLALDGGTGLPQGDTWIHRHGTDMASVIAAPRNDYGTIGVFPQARIVSVRVTEGDETYITPRAVGLGTLTCATWARERRIRLASVVMAESFYDQREIDVADWRGAVERARLGGGLFVAAVGNGSGSRSVAPLALADALAVSAGAEDGSLCSFAPVDLRSAIRGPGCAEGATWPLGSSAATAAVGALAAAVATRRPFLDPRDLRAEVLAGVLPAGDSSRFDGNLLSHRWFDGTLSTDQTGVGPQTQAVPSPTPVPVPVIPYAAVPVSNPLPSPTTGPTRGPGAATPVLATRLWRPTIRARWLKGRLVVKRRDRGPAGGLRLVLSGDAASVLTVRGPTVSMKVSKRPRYVEAWIEGETWRSLVRRAKVL